MFIALLAENKSKIQYIMVNNVGESKRTVG